MRKLNWDYEEEWGNGIKHNSGKKLISLKTVDLQSYPFVTQSNTPPEGC